MKKPYTIANTATGQVAHTSTYRAAQIATRRMIASDVEGQVVTIVGPDGRWEARADGFFIDYRKVAA